MSEEGRVDVAMPLDDDRATVVREPVASEPATPDMTRLLVGLVGVAIIIITLLTITAILAGPPAG